MPSALHHWNFNARPPHALALSGPLPREATLSLRRPKRLTRNIPIPSAPLTILTASEVGDSEAIPTSSHDILILYLPTSAETRVFSIRALSFTLGFLWGMLNTTRNDHTVIASTSRC